MTWFAKIKILLCRFTDKMDGERCADRSETYSYLAGGAGEERLSHLDVAGHSDLRVSLQRFVE